MTCFKDLLPTLRLDGSRGLPEGGSDHEEATAPEAHPTVRRLHVAGAHLHHHGADEARQPAGLSAE